LVSADGGELLFWATGVLFVLPNAKSKVGLCKGKYVRGCGGVCVKIIQANLVSAISESGVYVCFWPGPKVECAAEAVAR